MRWLTNLYDFRFKWATTAGIEIHPTKARFLQSGRVDTLEERYAIKFCFKLEKMPQKRMKYRRKRPAPFKSGQWNFHQDNAPVHNSIFVIDYLNKMGIKTVLSLSIVQAMLPVTFGYSLSLDAVVMRQPKRWKRLWRRSLTRSHKRTSMGPSRIFGTVQVQCSRKRLLQRGLEFHVFSINKSAYTKKSLETYLMILIFILPATYFRWYFLSHW